jgi:hypothetical protein
VDTPVIQEGGVARTATRAEVGLYGFVGDLSIPRRFSFDLPAGLCLRDLLEKIA